MLVAGASGLCSHRCIPRKRYEIYLSVALKGDGSPIIIGLALATLAWGPEMTDMASVRMIHFSKVEFCTFS